MYIQFVVVTTGPVSFLIKCQCQCKTQITDCRETMICGLDTRGKMQYYFHCQVLTINKLSGLKFCTLGRLNSAPISLNIMQVSPKNSVFTTKTASSSTTKLTIRL